MRIIYFSIVVCASVVLPWWLTLPLWAIYACVYPARELIVLGVLLDAYVGYTLPWHVLYTSAAVLLCIGMELLRPRMAFYEEPIR